MEKITNNREVNTGKYTYTGGMERLCKCGHSLGDHCATKYKGQNGYEQECMVDQVKNESFCDCKLFKPKK